MSRVTVAGKTRNKKGGKIPNIYIFIVLQDLGILSTQEFGVKVAVVLRLWGGADIKRTLAT
jgi:hypothetical protein